MSRKFIAAVLAVATSIAAVTAAPARAASEEDIARILGAAATVFIIGKAIEQSRDKDRDDHKKNTYVGSNSQKYKPHVQPNRHYTPPKAVPRHARPNRGKAALPAQCVQRVNSGRVNRVVMEHCLDRSFRGARNLPRSCRMTVSTGHGRRTAYALPCLRDHGYSIARN